MNAKVCFGAWTFGVATWLSAWPSCFQQIILLKVRKCLRVFSDWLVLCATVEGGRGWFSVGVKGTFFGDQHEELPLARLAGSPRIQG